jgi:hypothetical protein
MMASASGYSQSGQRFAHLSEGRVQYVPTFTPCIAEFSPLHLEGWQKTVRHPVEAVTLVAEHRVVVIDHAWSERH